MSGCIAIGSKVSYENAGTVEFLVDDEADTFYFIEVNPRLQVEHTITEVVTGIDIVKCQILVAQGSELSNPDIGIVGQESIQARLRYPVPDYFRGSHKQLHARLRPDHALSLFGRPRLTTGWRFDHDRCDHHAVL